MENFCEGEFWNTTLLLDSTWPQFTDCFVHTVLIWVPCSFLFLMLPYYITSVRQRATDIELEKTSLFGARLCCCIILVILSLIHVAMRTKSFTLSTSPAAYLGDALYITSYITLCLMTHYEHVKGVHVTAVPFFFWLLTSLCNIIPLYTMIMQERHIYYTVSFTILVLTYTLQLSSLTLTAFVNNRGAKGTHYSAKKLCPEITCSFPSYLTFWWMTRLVMTGFSRDLEDTDLWMLPHSECSAPLTARFNSLWDQEKRACHEANCKEFRKKNVSTKAAKETTPLHSKDSQQKTQYGQHTEEKEEKDRRRPRLLLTLMRMVARDFSIIFLQKTISDIIFLCTPVLLGVLMTYLAERPAGRQWQGYVLCASMFLALTLKSLLFAHSMFLAARIGIRMKSVLIAAIYQKALSMSSVTRATATVGEIVTLMSVDAQRVQDMMIVCCYAVTTPLQFCVAVGLLYYIIGPSIFVGVLLLVCCVPINAYVIARQRCLQSTNLTLKDARVKLYNEVFNGMKVLKLYAWEPSFREKIREIRLKEVAVLFKVAVLNTITNLCWEMAPFLVTLVTFATYVLSDPNHKLNASKAFVSLALFNVLRPPLAVLPKMIMYLILVQVSVKRIIHFLVSSDLDPDAVIHKASRRPTIKVKDGTFTWNPHLMCHNLRNINVKIAQGRLVAVVGPVGSGKSSLLNAMLGEMDKVKGAVISKGDIAYVPQQVWIQHATVRDNILFGKPFSRNKFKQVIQKCELERDLSVLSDADMTQIGEKGINLSGGQKQRVSMARAVYSDSDVYLLDDPLSAVDSHIGKAIFNNVIGPNGLLRNKTRVLVTHGVHWLPMVDEIIVMHDGIISERGSYEELMSHDGPFAQFLKTYLTEVFEVNEEEQDPEIAEIHGKMRVRLGSVTSCDSSEDDSLRVKLFRRRHKTAVGTLGKTEDSVMASTASDGEKDADLSSTGRLNTSETVSKGKVSPRVFWYYASAVGVLHLLLALACFCIFQIFSVSANFWLKEWTRQESPPCAAPNVLNGPLNDTTDHNATELSGITAGHCNTTAADQGSDHSTNFYLAVYGALGIGQGFFFSLNSQSPAAMGERRRQQVEVKGGERHQQLPQAATQVSSPAPTVPGPASQGSASTATFALTADGKNNKEFIFLFAFNIIHWSRMAIAARSLHSRLADSMMRAPMSFFDTTPTGRVLNRVSYDVEVVDTTLPLIIRDWLVTFGLVMVTLAVVLIHTPLAGLVLLPLSVLFFFCQRFYVPTARQLRRIESVSRSPIYVLFSETLSGAASIRAYNMTQTFLEESKTRVDDNQVFYFAYQAAIRWMQWNLDVISAVIVLAASMFAISNSDSDPGDAGLCISYALQISGTLTWMTRQICEFETNVVSVERLKEYSELETEDEWVVPHKCPPQHWPENGQVTFCNYQTRYRHGLDLVLRGVTFTIEAGKMVGIVGRTGAGKSSLTLALFRLIEATGGSILIDGVNIADIGLHDLRSRLTILPQDPVLFSGTLRMNLDPFDEYTDSQLWTALDKAHLRNSVNSLPGQLAFHCGEEGCNLSVGQRQLVCLARVLLRRTKILVLDEATAAVDMETDALIQNTIRSAFSQCTVITIAHRLNTIMDYDMILVMADGRIEEYASPSTLLANKTSAFFGMARDAGLV